jgi:hypothetical protein
VTGGRVRRQLEDIKISVGKSNILSGFRHP